MGSSLSVASGYRFARAAARRGLPFALVNLGRTWADEEDGLRVTATSGEVLPAAVARLGAG